MLRCGLGLSRRGGGGRRWGRLGRGFGALVLQRTQDDLAFLLTGLHPAGNFALRDPGEHLGIGLRWFGTEVAVIRGQIAEILGNGLHRAEGIVEAFQRARKSAIGDRQDFVAVHHRMLVLCGVAGIVYHDVQDQSGSNLCHSTYDFKARLRQISIRGIN
ncbi:hypothetical protein [Sulfitobacter faviae]|uniref:hypothetical protein n=1 Tax=Sulfitobacter faviae TaxID=1775881 RepID=UPI0031BA0964